ncbi:MAG TPA: glycosyltransferase family 39 protein [Ktedonobacteraceae bacterium]|nr:glycosyltransferase family 39 protein [Ktedonobacteraceae bacterium]
MTVERNAEIESASLPSVESYKRQSIFSSSLHQVQSILRRTPVALVAVVVGLITFLVHGYRLGAAPDVFSDEGVYLLIGISVAKGKGITVNGMPFLYHPPAYFLIEAAYIKLARLTGTDLLTALFSVRYLNVFFSASTASLLLLFGRKLHSYKAGLITAGLFLMDPYVQRINRRNMLESLAMLCVLIGFYIFFTHAQRLRNWRWLGSGIAFGLAALTKEPMLLFLFAFPGIVAWANHAQLGDATRTTAIACLLYLLYPLWEFTIGQGSLYLAYKRSEVDSVIVSITSFIGRQGGNVYAPKRVSPENLQILLGTYGSSYLLIGLAGIFTIILFLRFRPIMEARFLLLLGVFSFGFGLIFGHSSDQYFYYLIVPALLVNGYCLAILSESLRYPRRWRIAIPLFLYLLFLYNCGLWITNYGFGSDDGYTKIITYVKAHIPADEIINASDDVASYFLSPAYDVRLDRDKKVIIALHEHYFIMSSKDQWDDFNGTTPQFYDWIVQNSQPLLVEQDASFWTIGLYYFKVPGGNRLTSGSAGHSSQESSAQGISPYIYQKKPEQPHREPFDNSGT